MRLLDRALLLVWFGIKRRGSQVEKSAHIKCWEWYPVLCPLLILNDPAAATSFTKNTHLRCMPLDFLCVLNGVRKMESFTFKKSGDLNDF